MNKVSWGTQLKKHVPVFLLSVIFFLLLGVAITSQYVAQYGNLDEYSMGTSVSSSVPGMMPSMGGAYRDYSYGGDASVVINEPQAMDNSLLYPPVPMPIVAPSDAGATLKDRKVIQNGQLSLRVESVEKTIGDIKMVALSKSGRVDNISYDNSGNFSNKQATLTVRVPADKFEESMQALKSLAIKIENENVSTSDVTAQFVDIEARLKNLRSAEKQYQEIMDDATKIPDILQVSNRLFEVRQEIEQLEAQKESLTGEVDMSTIIAQLTSEPEVSPVPVEWKPWTTIKQAFAALLVVFTRVLDFIIFLLILLLPVLIVLIITLAFIFLVVLKTLLAFKRRVDRSLHVSSKKAHSSISTTPARRTRVRPSRAKTSA